MEDRAADIAQLLNTCETTGAAPEYLASNLDNPKPPVPIASNGAEIFVVSDLHLADGLSQDLTYSGNENFFCDSSFRRFLRRAHANLKSTSAILVINGDFIDFLRIIYVPREDVQFADWKRILEEIGIHKSIDELKSSIVKKELTYGLRTNGYKSVPKLDVAVNGHTEFFEALAEWLCRGHRLIIVKGNHDLEWYWLPVRNYLRLALARKLAGQLDTTDIKSVLENKVLPHVTFIDDSMLIDADFYIEHGHRFDHYAHVAGDTVRGEELNIPFGSFLNRYLLNDIELNYPFLDNVRPSTNILPLLFRERLPLALKLLFLHIPFVIHIIPKGYFSYMFRQVFLFGLVVVLPMLFIISITLGMFGHGLDLTASLTTPSRPESTLHKVVFNALTSLGSLIASYFLGRLVGWLNLKEPGDLTRDAQKKLAENTDYRLVTFGHTHNPDQFRDGQRWFFNTGTWIPIVELSSAEIREDKTYTFLHLKPNSSGKLEGALCRWDDEAERSESAAIIKRAKE
jgi:UDP-2,3-diacylglucosamine pyrophosphatase LpxH